MDISNSNNFGTKQYFQYLYELLNDYCTIIVQQNIEQTRKQGQQIINSMVNTLNKQNLSLHFRKLFYCLVEG